MDFKTVITTTRQIEKFLLGREWEIDGELTGILDRANREIERIQADARQALVGKLERYQKEAQRGADNKVFTLWTQEHIPLTKREQQASATDVRHIHAAIVRIKSGE